MKKYQPKHAKKRSKEDIQSDITFWLGVASFLVSLYGTFFKR